MVSSNADERRKERESRREKEVADAGTTTVRADLGGKTFVSTCRAALLKGVLGSKLSFSRFSPEKKNSMPKSWKLHAELATAVRGSDILRSELRNAMDDISTITHRLKDLELQMSKKDENVTRLEIELKESTEEVVIAREIMPQISKERNLMRDEARQWGEENTRLSTEVGLLRKKIEALEEEVLLKEGQITIVKDTITNKPFDLFANPYSPEEFLLK